LGVNFDAGLVEARNFGVGSATDRHKHAIKNLFILLYVGTFESDADSGLFVLQRLNGGVEQNRREEFFQTLVQRQNKIAIGTRQNARQHFNAGNFCPESGVDRTEFEPNISAADDEQRLRNVGEIESSR